MKIFKLKKDLQQYLGTVRAGKKTIGLVPTMGALHTGHLSLLERAKSAGHVVVCSIFVNPTQFNDPADLDKYPRPIAHDIAMLEQAGCDVLFNPAVNEMYAGHEQWHLDIGGLEFILEGEFRPGHYQGVMQVVHKLFTVVEPDEAYFGQKDYQQFLVIGKMADQLNLPVKLVMCPIIREADGLAMSSRNVHLSVAERGNALALSRALFWLRDHFDRKKITVLQQQALDMLHQQPGIKPEYFTIANADTLQGADETTGRIIALVAAWVGQTRLIDNIFLAPPDND